MRNYSSPLPRYLSGVPVTDLSCYFLQQRPETVWAALAKQKQKQREEYWESTREKRARESTQSQDKRKSSTSAAFNAAI